MRKTLGVIRGARNSVIEFYQHFETFDVRFIAASFKPFVYTGARKDNFWLVNLPFYPPLGFDPALLVRQQGNLSWVFIKDLESYLAGCDAICITDSYYFFNLQVVQWAKKYSMPVVTIIWTSIPHHITTWLPPYSYITQQIVEATDLFILRSKTALQFTDSLDIPRNKVKVIYKGMNLSKFKPRPRKEKEDLKILFTGSLATAKGLDDLLDVYRRLRQKYTNISFIVAGDGEMKSELEKQDRKGIVDFRGFVAYDRLPELYAEADIFCTPSKYQTLFGIKVWEEYFSYTLMEAQAAGLPIVSTKTGGILEEVGDDNLLVKPGDRKALAEALEKLIVNPSLRERLGWENRKRAEKLYDARKQALETENAILDLLHKRK